MSKSGEQGKGVIALLPEKCPQEGELDVITSGKKS
jgi:hypothetical protein